MSFIENGLVHISKTIKIFFLQWEYARKRALFQILNVHIKLIFLISFVVIISLKNQIHTQLLIASFIFLLVLLSRLPLINFYKRILFLGFIFGFLVVLPSAFNVIRSGEVVLPIFNISRSYEIWVYHIPRTIGITNEGMLSVIMLTLRIINSISVSFLVIYTTPFYDIIKALKLFRVPDDILMIIILSYNYIFIFSNIIEEIYLAKLARTLIKNNNKDARKWVAGRIAFIFHKTQQRYEDIYKAMLSKGFSGKIKLYSFEKNNIYDYAIGALLFIAEIYFCII